MTINSSNNEADACSILLFVDEGRMFHKVIEHSRRYPEATPLLMLSILPFLALTVHDSVRFVRKYFDATVPLDSNAVNRLRNASKALSSKGLHIEEYALEAKAITSTLTASAKNHSGLFGDLQMLCSQILPLCIAMGFLFQPHTMLPGMLVRLMVA